MTTYVESQPVNYNPNTHDIDDLEAGTFINEVIAYAKSKHVKGGDMAIIGAENVEQLNMRHRTMLIDRLWDAMQASQDPIQRRNLQYCLSGIAQCKEKVYVSDAKGNPLNPEVPVTVIKDRLFGIVREGVSGSDSLAKRRGRLADEIAEVVFGRKDITATIRNNPALRAELGTVRTAGTIIKRAATISAGVSILTGMGVTSAAAYTSSAETPQAITIDTPNDSAQVEITLAQQPVDTVTKTTPQLPIEQQTSSTTEPSPEPTSQTTAPAEVSPQSVEAPSLTIAPIAPVGTTATTSTVPFMTDGETAAEFYQQVTDQPGLEGVADAAANLDAREMVMAATNNEVARTDETQESEATSEPTDDEATLTPNDATTAEPQQDVSPGQPDNVDARAAVAPWAEAMIDEIGSEYADEELSRQLEARIGRVERAIEYLANNPDILPHLNLDEKSSGAAIINAALKVLANDDNDLNRHTDAHAPTVLEQMIAQQPEIANYPEETQQMLARSFAYLGLVNLSIEELNEMMPDSLRAEFEKEAKEKREEKKRKREEKEAAAQAAAEDKEVVALTNAQIRDRTLDRLIENAEKPKEKRTFIAFRFFIEQGWTVEQAAGAIGNGLVESAGTMDPRIRQFGGGPGQGIFQWGNTKNPELDRWGYDGQRGLILFAKQHDLDPYDLITQLKFTMYEFDTTERSAYARFMDTDSVGDAAYVFMKFYERPRDDTSAERTERGEAVLAQYQALFDKIKQNDKERVEKEREKIREAREEAKRQEEERKREKEKRREEEARSNNGYNMGWIDGLSASTPGFTTDTETRIEGTQEMLDRAKYYIMTSQGQAEISQKCGGTSHGGCNGMCARTTAIIGLERPQAGHNAYDWWLAYDQHGHPGDKSIPIGAIVFFKPNAWNGWYGHVGIYVGDGTIITNLTDKGIVGVREMSFYDDKNNPNDGYVGWIDPNDL